MLSSILGSIICSEFELNVGKGQSRAEKPIGFYLPIRSTPVDGANEDVYNHTDLLIFAEHNYVGVYTRERWTPALEGVQAGETDWKIECYHDSCWRTAVSDFFFNNRGRLSVLNTFSDWYHKIPVNPEMMAILKKVRNDEYHDG